MANNPSLLGAAGRAMQEVAPVLPNGRAPEFSGIIQSLRSKKPTTAETMFPTMNQTQGFFARFTPR